MATAHAGNDLFMGMLAPLYPIVQARFALSLGLVGAVSMIAGITSAFSQPLFGVLVDRHGVAASLHLAPLLTAVFICLVPTAPSFPLLLVLLALGCLGSAAFHPKGASVTPSLSGGHPEIGMAIFSAVGNLGYSAGPIVIASLIAARGAGAAPLLIVPAVALTILLFVLLPPRVVEQRSRAAARLSFRQLLADRRELPTLLRLIFVNFCLTVALRAMTTFLPVRLSALGEPVTSIGILFTIVLGLGAVLSILASSMARRFGAKPLIISSVLAGAPLYVLGLLVAGLGGRVLLVAGGAALSWSNPLVILQAQRHSGNSPAMASSLLMGVSWGLASLAMTPLGALGELTGTWVLLLVSAAFPLLGLVSAFRLPKE